MSEENKPMFGITKDTKANNVSPIRVAKKVENDPRFPSGWEFPIARLVNVIANPEFEKKDGSKVAIIDFVFKDVDGRQYIHREWELETTDAKFSDKLEYMQIRIKHIFVTIFSKFPDNGIGGGAGNFKEFFNIVAQTFNSITTTEGEGEDAKKVKVYPKVSLYLKLTYYKKNLGFPLSPDFLEKVVKNQPCKILTINPVYDKLEPQMGANNIPGAMGGGMTMEGSDELPTFDDTFDD